MSSVKYKPTTPINNAHLSPMGLIFLLLPFSFVFSFVFCFCVLFFGFSFSTKKCSVFPFYFVNLLYCPVAFSLPFSVHYPFVLFLSFFVLLLVLFLSLVIFIILFNLSFLFFVLSCYLLSCMSSMYLCVPSPLHLM